MISPCFLQLALLLSTAVADIKASRKPASGSRRAVVLVRQECRGAIIMEWLLILFGVPAFLAVGFFGMAMRGMLWFLPQVNPL